MLQASRVLWCVVKETGNQGGVVASEETETKKNRAWLLQSRTNAAGEEVGCPSSQAAWSRSPSTVLRGPWTGSTQRGRCGSHCPPGCSPSQLLGPRGSSPGGHITACIKPAESFGGAQLYLEHGGVLELLAGDRPDPAHPARVRCVSRRPGETVTLFLQATPHQDISRRIAAFHYELRGDWTARPALTSDPVSSEGACRPCNDTEMLMAVCTSDFVVRGSIRSVSDDGDLQTSVIHVAATRVFRQKYALFSGTGRLTKAGEIRTLLRCGVRPGAGSFLFTGRVHFGEAWLGCAPRYKDFRKAYDLAREAGLIPCELLSD
ncbi:hypothetical protein SKAU_G00289260 [Synaphobranchus kaupii]|uniref:Meteorin n=1 Tax=Synaphobranchus kaupii TaxID=118154 RepID=A0A9Q1ETH4_SYNKA|nr:hypothetical protein SKAU_G00289260 [Synaphobranchus kaupii]